MYKIALTGGIGTGKTYLSTHFVEMGIPVFYADDEAKKLYEDPHFLAKLCARFGDDILSKEGGLNRTILASRVFSDEDTLHELNALVHPAVMNLFDQWCAHQEAKAVMMESAIIFEGHLEGYFDKIIVADAPLELRIQRAMSRNPEMTRDQVLQRMSKQLPQEEKCSRADLVICTGETYTMSKDFNRFV